MPYKKIEPGKVLIYSLKDPFSNEIRYVGKTSWSLPCRLHKHCIPSALKQKNHRTNWIQSILKQGKRPTIDLLEETNDKDWVERERYWIKKLGSSGRLVNSCEGGQGPHGIKWSLETRKKMSESAKNRSRRPHTEETKRKIGDAQRGKPRPNCWTPESKAKVSASLKGRIFTQEHRNRIGDSNRRRKLSPESRAKISASLIKYNEERRLSNG